MKASQRSAPVCAALCHDPAIVSFKTDENDMILSYAVSTRERPVRDPTLEFALNESSEKLMAILGVTSRISTPYVEVFQEGVEKIKSLIGVPSTRSSSSSGSGMRSRTDTLATTSTQSFALPLQMSQEGPVDYNDYIITSMVYGPHADWEWPMIGSALGYGPLSFVPEPHPQDFILDLDFTHSMYAFNKEGPPQPDRAMNPQASEWHPAGSWLAPVVE
jgi:hypothetical protein